MKTKLSLLYLWSFIFGLALCTEPSALSQIPQGFNYQAIARDGSGNPIANTSLPVRITIQADSLGTTILWQEVHASVTSNNYGLINLVIGRGTRQASSAVAMFSDIDWTVTPKFIKTEIYFGVGYLTMGVSRLWSVPYAAVAEDLAGSVKKLSVEGETSLFDEALFEVKNKNGQTIFAVYNEGVRIYVDDGAKGPKGGFAVGGFDMNKATKREYFVVSDDSVRIYLDSNPLTKGKKSGFAVGGYDMTKGVIQNYLDVSADSVRVYIDSDPTTKKVKGGFAVGGYDMTKAPVQEYLRVTRDSTRVYVNEDASKSIKGGFAVGGFDATDGTVTNFTSLTPENYLIGHQAGRSITSGRYNSFLGYETGLNTDIGNNNIFLGFQAGLNNKGDIDDPGTGCNNIFIGNKSGFSNVNGFRNLYIGYEAGYLSEGWENTFIGNQAGYRNNGTSSTFVGYRAGYNSAYSDYNTFIGSNAGENNNDGMGNVFIGVASGMNNIVGSDNVFIGNASGAQNGAGSDNVAIGYSAGQTGNDGRGNVLIGYNSGYSINGDGNITLGYYAGYNETGANRLYIANTCGSTLAVTKSLSLIYGEFDNKILTFNAKVGIGTLVPSQSLEISGTDSKIYLNSAASNMLLYNLSGVAVPSFTTRSTGTKIVLYPGIGVSSADFAIGIESNNIWYSVPRANSTYSHKFYGGITELMRIRGDGYVGIGTTSPETKLHVNPGQVTLDGSSNPYVMLNNGPYQGYLEISSNNLALTHAGTVRLAITPTGMVGINTTSPGAYRLYVSGSAYSTGGWAGSDVRWKKNISGIRMILDEISQLNPVYYEWKKEDFPEMSFDSGVQIGLIAQEVEKTFPELVKTNEDGFKAVSYEKLTVVLLEGMKEQQQQIDELKALVNKLVQK